VKVYKRGNIWWFKLQFEGTLYRRSTEHTNKVKAETAAAAFRTALANRKFGVIEHKPVPDFEKAMKSFLAWSEGEKKNSTHRRYKISSKALLAYRQFRGKKIDKMTGKMIEDYKTYRARQKGKRTKRQIKPATINRELACLKAMFFHALKDGHEFKNPLSKKLVGDEAVKLLSEDNEQETVLTFEEQRVYLAAASERLKDVATLVLETGMRPEEVYRARVEHARIEEGMLYNPYGKTKAARRNIPLNSVALDVIKRRLQAADGPYLFPHKSDKNKPMIKANNAHDRTLKKCKVKKFRLYDLRHTWGDKGSENHGSYHSGFPARTFEAQHGYALRPRAEGSSGRSRQETRTGECSEGDCGGREEPGEISGHRNGHN
jgi:integrase